MSMQDRDTIVAIMEDRPSAERAMHALEAAGIDSNRIGFASREEGWTGEQILTPGDTHAGTGAVAGALAGGASGALLVPALAGLIPGVGPFLAGGALATTLIAAAAGGGTGALFGMVIGLGFTEDEARLLEEEFKAGHPLVFVQSDDRRSEIVDVLRSHGARFSPSPDIYETDARITESDEGVANLS